MQWHFCVWAPNAAQVSLVGSFNGWDIGRHPMQKQHDGTWELRLPEEELWRNAPADGFPVYKYAVLGADGTLRLKADPFGFFSELRPDMGSRLYDLDGYAWRDRRWMEKRSTLQSVLKTPSTSTRCTSAPGGGTRTEACSTYLEFADAADSLRDRDGVHAHRAAARDGAPAGYVLGVSGARVLRRHVALTARPSS